MKLGPMLHPILCIASVLVTFIITFGLFVSDVLNVDEFFFISIPILICIYTIIAIVRDREIYLQRRWFHSPLKIIGQYLFWGTLTYLLTLLYERHTFYSQVFPNAKLFFQFYFKVYVWAGLPYFILADKFRASVANDRADAYLLWASFFRKILKKDFSVLQRLRHNRYYRNFIISAILRSHFIALMVSQMLVTHQQVTKTLQEKQWEYAIIIAALNAMIWSFDANNASIGYFWESKFTKTRFREMDPYPLNWVVTIMCYLPFSYWVSTFLPQMIDHSQAIDYIVQEHWFTVTTDILALVCLFGYIWAGSSLYFSTSNMVYKSIQTKGPYAFVRHPATFFKIGFFCVTFFKFADSYTLLNCFAFFMWMSIYVGRTICEERFLTHFEEYRSYKLKTRYRIIPGVY